MVFKVVFPETFYDELIVVVFNVDNPDIVNAETNATLLLHVVFPD